MQRFKLHSLTTSPPTRPSRTKNAKLSRFCNPRTLTTHVGLKGVDIIIGESSTPKCFAGTKIVLANSYERPQFHSSQSKKATLDELKDSHFYDDLKKRASSNEIFLKEMRSLKPPALIRKLNQQMWLSINSSIFGSHMCGFRLEV